MLLFMIHLGLNIDISTKIKWITTEFPNVKILEAYDSPKQYGLDEQSVKIQMEYLIKIIKNIPVNYFYSSEPYGKYVAEYLNIENVLVDAERKVVPISSGRIRSNPKKYKEYLNDDVKKDLFII